MSAGEHTAPSSDALAGVAGTRFNWEKHVNRLLQVIGLPLIGIAVFLMIWQMGAASIQTSLGQFPGPAQVWDQAGTLVQEHIREREKAGEFYERQEVRNAKKLEKNPDASIKWRDYTGKSTFFDQIFTSLYTVAVGFILASLIAIPVGIACGLNESFYRACNPIIQVFKPVSPLAWLPLVTMVVSAVYTSEDPLFDKSFLNSAFTVALCCLWPTLINTTVGVSSVDKDLVNVSRVMALPTLTHIRRIVLPSAIPMIFTGLRLSLATGWMVLIAAEMLAQNPGLGKFIWDEFQNGSSNSLGRIMVAVVVIGLTGFALDKLMLILQKRVSWDKHATLR
ncbi:ABC transporter permease [Halieaceae bacterium IMCC14734]|uniref:ABC transporter permease n=1 Tax=Candidatus Litorirhabdus singularis TaxID=2518993 RepID=A0ABT3TEJ6_9GAMM|nr:ABC transporter permease [Candidatus Litorirhabdus singularis]MCX2980738.1 ABC transporter permease [Candidatus Litorirhabdus singularis]